MKNLRLVIIIISIPALLQAQDRWTKNQQSVQQTIVKLFEALSNRDSVGLKLYCADDIKLYEYGEVWNRDSLVSKAITLNTAADFKRVNSLDFISTTINKNVAWATYHLSSEITRDGKHVVIKWMETVILIKEKNNWKVKVLHSSLIKRT